MTETRNLRVLEPEYNLLEDLRYKARKHLKGEKVFFYEIIQALLATMDEEKIFTWLKQKKTV